MTAAAGAGARSSCSTTVGASGDASHTLLSRLWSRANVVWLIAWLSSGDGMVGSDDARGRSDNQSARVSTVDGSWR